MLHIRIILSLGVITLYLGFAGVLGVLLQRARNNAKPGGMRALTLLYAGLLFLPASIGILGFADWPRWVRFAIALAGLGITWLGYQQPHQLPEMIWERTFAHAYFAVVMALAAAWGFSLSFATQAFLPLPVAAAASLASLSSLLAATRLI